MGFLPIFEKHRTLHGERSLYLSAVITGCQFECTLKITGKRMNRSDAILFVEKIARNICRQTGRKFNELILNREITLFEESLELSRRLIKTSRKERGDLEHYLGSAWSLPADARVIAFENLEHFATELIPVRFASNMTISEEVMKTCNGLNNSDRGSSAFKTPPILRLSEVLYQYLLPLGEDERGGGNNKIP